MRATGVIAALLLLAVPARGQAQDRLTLFLHGFNSTASGWWDTATRLQARLQLTPAIPDLPWTQSYDAQADYLNGLSNLYGAPANMVAVGHSNGGVVARQLATKRSLGGIVTLGSPHLGAPLARNGNAAAWYYADAASDLGLLLYLVGAINGTNQYTGLWFSPGLAPLRAAVAALGAALSTASQAAYYQYVATSTLPVMNDMKPDSAVLNALNTGGNLGRESAVVPARAGLVFAARDWWIGAPFVAVDPGNQYVGETSVRTGMVFLSYIASYFSPPNVAPWDASARTIRNQAEGLIADLLYFNSVWCGATTNVPDCSVSTDGVVPTESQFFPGDARNFGFYGPAHVRQRASAENYLHDALRDVVGLRPRDGSSGGGGGAGGGGGTPSSSLMAGQRLYPESELRSPNGQYALRYQSDGNLVTYGPQGPVWSSGTNGRGGGYVEMQVDGNFVIYPADGGEPWASNTAGLPGLELRLQNDGYIVIYDSGQNVIWYAPN